MKKIFLLVGIILLSISGPFSASAITISAYDSAANLAKALEGSNVTISNVTYTGATAASGYFSGGIAAGIGFDSGIILTSGYASNVNGTSNTSDGITGDNGLSGDSDLNTLIPGYTTYDATILSFDFALNSDSNSTSVYFNYVFASEEYNEYVNSSFNDVFGFFVDGSNIALIPGTTTAVSINNVNNDSNSSYYNDNDIQDTSVPFAFEYDGFTTMLTAVVTGLEIGKTYNIKLAIADAGDYVLDSGVFIQAKSFADVITPGATVPEPGTMLLLGLGLLGFAGINRKK